ncbi:unnamed protein product [Mytilus edulis]|uniref:Uncharacterized protein n=1 Tax=Mytilus edulis TaxID=6550 RepID=A0A8S3U6G9_MYTED|nr:unnamed protein product [Mytilus edulis]
MKQHQEVIKADNSRSKMQIQLIEEGSENVYDILDESALSKTLEPFTSRMQNSYLDVTYSPKIPMNVENNLGIICIASVSSQSKMAQETSLRRQRGGLEESIISCQGALVHFSAYSMVILGQGLLNIILELTKRWKSKGHFIQTKTKWHEKENDGYIYDEPAYDGIVRAGIYESHLF